MNDILLFVKGNLSYKIEIVKEIGCYFLIRLINSICFESLEFAYKFELICNLENQEV